MEERVTPGNSVPYDRKTLLDLKSYKLYNAGVGGPLDMETAALEADETTERNDAVERGQGSS